MAQSPAEWEKKNWVASAPYILSKERDFLIAWREGKGKLQLLPDSAPPPPDPRLKEVLGALGYIQGMEPMKTPPPKKETSGKAPARPRR